MSSIKRTFYMVLGFTFPFFWAYHASGFADILFKPIQWISSTESTLWPSFITAFLIYSLMITVVEKLTRPRRSDYTIEWPDLRETKNSEVADSVSKSPDKSAHTEQINHPDSLFDKK